LSTTPSESNNRPQLEPRRPGIYFDTIGQGYRYITEDWLTWVLTSLLFFVPTSIGFFVWAIVFGILTQGEVNPNHPVMTPKVLIIFFLSGSVFAHWVISFCGGMIEMALRQIRGEAINARMIFLGFRQSLNGYVALLVSLVAIFMGLTFIFPGFYLLGVLAFAPYLPALRDTDALEALRMSFSALWRFGVSMFLLLTVAVLVSFSGILACFVGVLITFPILAFVIALHYTYFFPNPTGDALFQPLAETPAS
jgi:hypothetical protein